MGRQPLGGTSVVDTSATFCDAAAHQGIIRMVRMHPGTPTHVAFPFGPAAPRRRVLVVEDEYFLADDIARAGPARGRGGGPGGHPCRGARLPGR